MKILHTLMKNIQCRTKYKPNRQFSSNPIVLQVVRKLPTECYFFAGSCNLVLSANGNFQLMAQELYEKQNFKST